MIRRDQYERWICLRVAYKAVADLERRRAAWESAMDGWIGDLKRCDEIPDDARIRLDEHNRVVADEGWPPDMVERLQALMTESDDRSRRVNLAAQLIEFGIEECGLSAADICAICERVTKRCHWLNPSESVDETCAFWEGALVPYAQAA